VLFKVALVGRVPLKVATRCGLVGLGGLALLAAVQGLRSGHMKTGAVGAWLLGIGPNFAAAIAITFVLLAAWLDMAPVADVATVRRRFHASAAVSAIGLIGWEFVQLSAKAFVFDWQDMLATLAGIAVSFGLFAALRAGETAGA